MESSSISFSENKYAYKMGGCLPIFLGQGVTLGLREKNRVPSTGSEEIRVPATLYTHVTALGLTVQTNVLGLWLGLGAIP